MEHRLEKQTEEQGTLESAWLSQSDRRLGLAPQLVCACVSVRRSADRETAQPNDVAQESLPVAAVKSSRETIRNRQSTGLAVIGGRFRD